MCCFAWVSCTAIKPGQPLELVEEEGPVSDDFTVVVAGSSSGDMLRHRAHDGGSSSRPSGGSSGSDGSSKSWVLASGGFEDADASNN
jgi:uncharacterized membrane protein YgcG